MNMRPSRSHAKLSIVLPLLNEVAILPRLLSELRHNLDAMGVHWNIILVNDGSTDGSGELLDAMAFGDRRLKIVHLSRNFGHQAAVHAGLSYADGDAVVLMDSDGQDDPTAIGEMFQLWQAGDDVVYAVRFGRKENLIKRFLFKAFYGVLRRMASIDIPRDAGNFSLLDRRVVQQLLELEEHDRYLPGLRSWVGFKQSSIRVERFARHDKNPRVSLMGLFGLAKNALFGFSRVPLQTFYYMAFLATVLACSCYGLAALSFVTYNLLFFTELSVAGTVALFGAMNAMGIAVVGEYIVRIYDQVRNRPKFIVDRVNHREAWSEPVDREQEYQSLLDEVEELRRELDRRTNEARTAESNPPSKSHPSRVAALAGDSKFQRTALSPSDQAQKG
jgi:polyisoprenyl-phosphate glycosyltransferase